MINFDNLLEECEKYLDDFLEPDLEEQFYIHLNSDYSAEIFTYGFTPFETFKSVIQSTSRPKRFIVCGCSIGYQLFFWNKLFPDIPAIGIDLMSSRIDWGLEKLAKYDIDNVMLIEGDFQDFQVQDGDLIWQNNLMFDEAFMNQYNSKLFHYLDVEIVSYVDVNFGGQFIIDSNRNYKRIDCQVFTLPTSWSKKQTFYVYNKIKEEDVIFTVDDISQSIRVPENKLNSYQTMLLTRKDIKEDFLRNLYNKSQLKELFLRNGFNVPKTFIYRSEKSEFSDELSRLKKFVAKPAHASESLNVFISNGKTKTDFDRISKILNDSLDYSDSKFYKRQKVEGEIWWKNCEKGIIVEEYINVIYELKVFVVFGVPIIGDLREGSTEYHRVDFIKKHNSYLDWSKEYELIVNLANSIKLDFFRIDFLYDGDKLYASEMAIMPGTDLPEEIEDLIFRNWSRPYLKFYYPNFVL